MSALEESIKVRFEALLPVLDEGTRRVWAGAEAKAIGRGGISRVAAATGLARDAVRAGLREVEVGCVAAVGLAGERRRRSGGGRKALEERDPELQGAVERLLDPVTRGDPGSLRCAGPA